MQEGVYNELLDKTMKVQELNARIVFLDGAIELLLRCYEASIVRMINEMGIALLLGPNDDQVKALKMVQGRVKRMAFDKRKLEEEIDKIQADHGEEMTLEHFDDWLSIMSRAYGYAVKAKDITVMQFVRNIKKLNKEAEKRKADGKKK